jgi:hypothetical protein
MGEIKSTLDLVMEKTRHLTLSEEEKHAQSRLAEQKRLNGLLQKYEDGLMSLDQLQASMKEMQASAGGAADWMRTPILERIDPDLDNVHWLAVLKDFFGFDCSGLIAVLEDYRSDLNAAERRRIGVARDALVQTRNIKGSAVLPNLEADPQWVTERDEIRSCFQEMLDRLCAESTTGREAGG